MSTASEFVKSGIRGQTFVEIKDKFGKPFNGVAEEDPVMANYALAFAFFREQHLTVPEAYGKAMSLTTTEILALFDNSHDKQVQVQTDFVSPPLTTTP